MSNISYQQLHVHQFNVVGEIQTAFGFFKFYFENLHRYPDKETCFDFCNAFFKQQYGYSRYPGYQVFRGGVDVPEKKVYLSTEEKLRAYLMAYFKEKGFDSWASFSPLIMCYFPQVTAEKLHLFYIGKQLDKEVLKYVDYVRQIIGK